ncbi:hypothetical protein AciX8_3236 [Granulicella mallensis MP5ACTX8]|uniref:Uncharacterized protein n=1 Tax=Granulicella mallensis (strain ATCC BAA-1857 / DSM 23137 / MP5ACTX8) TaxID=682795 RepID=G8NTY1_GRAMM|nr:hypothetical protein AciX8_3236 [Granulicella mallensis MP5ACTX8]
MLFLLSFPQGICCLLARHRYLRGNNGRGTARTTLFAFTKNCRGTNKQQIPCGNDNKKSNDKNGSRNNKSSVLG